MQITMLAVGSRGDIQPFMALGVRLRQRGHAVRLATHAIFEAQIRAAGLDFAPLTGNPQAILQQPEGQAWLESAHNPFSFTRGFRQLMGDAVHLSMRDGYEAARGSDLIIITGPSFYFGTSIAEKLGVPFVQAYVQPIHPTTEFPSSLFPTTINGGPLFNIFTHYSAGMLFWQLMRPIVNDARRAFLQLPPMSRIGPFPEMMRARLPVIYGYSRHVLPRPRSWADHLQVTGYWFVDEPEWRMPDDLAAFLADGPPPVYIGFGSMVDRNPERMTRTVLDAINRSGQRGVLLTGWGGITQTDLPDHIFKISSAPHAQLFPHMAAVVHHGGAGTTAAGLRAGKPSVLVPFFGDQPFWGQRVAALGVGPQPIQRARLTAEQLASAIRQAVGDVGINARAARLGERIRAEDGADVAAAIIEQAVPELVA